MTLLITACRLKGCICVVRARTPVVVSVDSLAITPHVKLSKTLNNYFGENQD